VQKKKLTVYRILRCGNDFNENLTRTRLRHVYEAKGDPAFGHKGSSLLDGSHTTNRSFAFGNYIPLKKGPRRYERDIYNPLPIPYQSFRTFLPIYVHIFDNIDGIVREWMR
jgi:hypothetical protein